MNKGRDRDRQAGAHLQDRKLVEIRQQRGVIRRPDPRQRVAHRRDHGHHGGLELLERHAPTVGQRRPGSDVGRGGGGGSGSGVVDDAAELLEGVGGLRQPRVVGPWWWRRRRGRGLAFCVADGAFGALGDEGNGGAQPRHGQPPLRLVVQHGENGRHFPRFLVTQELRQVAWAVFLLRLRGRGCCCHTTCSCSFRFNVAVDSFGRVWSIPSRNRSNRWLLAMMHAVHDAGRGPTRSPLTVITAVRGGMMGWLVAPFFFVMARALHQTTRR